MRSIGSIISDCFGSGASFDAFTTTTNPSSGLPMMGGIGGLDIAGNAFGSSSNSHFSSFGHGGMSLSLFSHRFD